MTLKGIALIVLYVLTGALALAGCQVAVAPTVATPEQAPLPKESPTEIAIPTMKAVEEPLPVPAMQELLQYPQDFSDLDYKKGVGGEQESARNAIAAVAPDDLVAMESNWMYKFLWDGKISASSEAEVVRAFQKKYEFEYGLTPMGKWTALSRCKAGKECAVRTALK